LGNVEVFKMLILPLVGWATTGLRFPRNLDRGWSCRWNLSARIYNRSRADAHSGDDVENNRYPFNSAYD